MEVCRWPDAPLVRHPMPGGNQVGHALGGDLPRWPWPAPAVLDTEADTS